MPYGMHVYCSMWCVYLGHVHVLVHHICNLMKHSTGVFKVLSTDEARQVALLFA